MLLIDTHCHLFDLKHYTLPKEPEQPNTIYPVIIGYSHHSNKKVLEIAKKNNYPFALGVAPQTPIKENSKESEFDLWLDFIKNSSTKPNAIGEIGLDYKWAETKVHVEIQRKLFKLMLGCASSLKLPVVIHSRDKPTNPELLKETHSEVPENAIDEILDTLEKHHFKNKFLMHFYSGNEKQAARVIELGGMISLTHLRSKERRSIIETTPIEHLVIESDSPYVAKTPDFILEACQYIAEVKKLDCEIVAKETSKNAMRFFNFMV